MYENFEDYDLTFSYYTIIALVIGSIIGIITFNVPTKIAKKKNLDPSYVKLIKILQWLSIINGATWVIALVMSLVFKKSIKK
ncbi:MAG: hypothetical protein MJ247_01200 [Alphaproteobacteria bacterium]|nr:hypothetical protein [Alphaproteobacteria bacterium]